MSNKTVEWLLSIIGKKLVAVSALIYSYEDEKDFVNPQELDLHFQSCGHGKLSCSADGASIEWHPTSLKQSDLGDYGKQTVEDVSERLIWRNVITKILVDVKLLISDVEHCTIGIEFTFEGGFSLSVVNLGDELYVYDSIPDEVVNQQGIVLSDIA